MAITPACSGNAPILLDTILSKMFLRWTKVL